MVTLSEALEVLSGRPPDPAGPWATNDDGTFRWDEAAIGRPGPSAEELAAVTRRELTAARTARAAVRAMTRMADPGDVSDTIFLLRVLARDLYTQVNDLREAAGMARVPEPAIVARLVASVSLGAAAPLSPPTPG